MIHLLFHSPRPMEGSSPFEGVLPFVGCSSVLPWRLCGFLSLMILLCCSLVLTTTNLPGISDILLLLVALFFFVICILPLMFLPASLVSFPPLAVI